MASVHPNHFGRQQDRDTFVVKSESAHIDEQQAFQSSEDEFAGPEDGQSQPPEGPSFSSAGHQPPPATDSFHFASMVSSNAASGSSTPAKDPQPISKRTLQNRKAQREFRQRRATYLKDLEAKVRRYESDSAVIHPEVHHRINHLVQEIQYLRAIIDRLQQENAELRRLDPSYGAPQALPPSSQSTYTLHPAYSSAAIQRSPQGYESNPLAIAEAYQPQYAQPYGSATGHDGGENRSVSYSSDATAASTHVTENSRGTAGYPTNPTLEWSAMRHSVAAEDRPRTAPIDLAAPGALPRAERDHNDPAFLLGGNNQNNYYHASARPPHGHSEGSAPTVAHPSSHPSSYNANINPSAANNSASHFPQSGQSFPSSQAQRSVENQNYEHLEHGGSGWHNSSSAAAPSYNHAGSAIPHQGMRHSGGSFEHNFQSQQDHQGMPNYPRSGSHSP